MKKWYSAILREIRKLGDRIFVIDEYGLLKDPNFFKELRDRYYMHEYVNDAAFFKMYHSNSDCPMLVYSRKPVSRDFINRQFRKLQINMAYVFGQLNPDIMRQIDISYYQKVFDYYTELDSQGRIIDSTEDVLLKSIWGIDIG